MRKVGFPNFLQQTPINKSKAGQSGPVNLVNFAGQSTVPVTGAAGLTNPFANGQNQFSNGQNPFSQSSQGNNLLYPNIAGGAVASIGGGQTTIAGANLDMLG
jgi:hypothetical protein